jgi:hypothetical protein
LQLTLLGRGRPMRRIASLALLLAMTTLAVVLPASAQSAQDFKADFSEKSECPGFDLCGRGVVHGFGTATSGLLFTSFEPGAGNCVSAAADRTQTLSDGSTLLISASGTVCDTRIAGTFTIVGGTGVFAGASGGGMLSGSTTNPYIVSQAVHLRGTITLP